MFARAPLSLKARALASLALREHSRSELRRKLLAHAERAQDRAATAAGDEQAADAGAGRERLGAEVDALLDALQAQGLLCEERFVASRVRVRAERYGNRRIRAELAQHGLTPDAQTAADLAASEMARARAVWARKFAGLASDPKDRAKQMRFLASRGFSAEVVHRVLRSPSDD